MIFCFVLFFALCCEVSEILTQYDDEMCERGAHELVGLISKYISVWNCSLQTTVFVDHKVLGLEED